MMTEYLRDKYFMNPKYCISNLVPKDDVVDAAEYAYDPVRYYRDNTNIRPYPFSISAGELLQKIRDNFSSAQEDDTGAIMGAYNYVRGNFAPEDTIDCEIINISLTSPEYEHRNKGVDTQSVKSVLNKFIDSDSKSAVRDLINARWDMLADLSITSAGRYKTARDRFTARSGYDAQAFIENISNPNGDYDPEGEANAYEMSRVII